MDGEAEPMTTPNLHCRVALCAAFYVLCLLHGGSGATAMDTRPASTAPASAVAGIAVHPKNLEEMKRLEEHVVRLVREKLAPATVGVGSSSGVIVSVDGLVVCAAHTASKFGANAEITIALADGRQCKAKVAGMYRPYDTAVLRIVDKGPFPFVPMLMDAGEMEVEQWIIRIGYPPLTWHSASLKPEELGGPMVGLDREGWGIAIERPWSISGYMVPKEIVLEFLQRAPGLASRPGQAAGPIRPPTPRALPLSGPGRPASQPKE